jgi:hypothetical protein
VGADPMPLHRKTEGQELRVRHLLGNRKVVSRVLLCL